MNTAQRNALYAKARGAALSRLAERHPDEFDQLLAEERTARGLPAERETRQRGML